MQALHRLCVLFKIHVTEAFVMVYFPVVGPQGTRLLEHLEKPQNIPSMPQNTPQKPPTQREAARKQYTATMERSPVTIYHLLRG